MQRMAVPLVYSGGESVNSYTLEREQWLPRPPHEIFPFFAAASNLNALTPPWVGFNILTPEPIEMRIGAVIDYRIRLHGIPVRWQTEITDWEPPTKFVDEQRIGPYRHWVHTHTFVAKDGGTLCVDHVDYAVPMGWLIHRLFVRRDVERIFDFRQQALSALFPPPRS